MGRLPGFFVPKDFPRGVVLAPSRVLSKLARPGRLKISAH